MKKKIKNSFLYACQRNSLVEISLKFYKSDRFTSKKNLISSKIEKLGAN